MSRLQPLFTANPVSEAENPVDAFFEKIDRLSLFVGKGKRVFLTWEEALEAAEKYGEALGRLKVERQTLRRLLRHRFGAEADQLEDRLEAIDDPEQLQKLFDQAIEASSLEEVELGS